VLFDFANVLIFFLASAAFIYGTLIVARIVRPQRPYPEKLSTYECGEPPIGSAWIRYNIRFYNVALVFLIFDVEVIFLFPVAIVLKQLGVPAFLEVAFFVVVLALGFVYAWRWGNLDWVRWEEMQPETNHVQAITK
jgi:NADH-quinone oxidoreductase subunit A